MTARHHFHFLAQLALLCAGAATLVAQQPEHQPLGASRATGGVYVDGLAVTGEVKIFVGSTLRTGPDGAASLSVPGRGLLLLSPETEISFVASPRYFASLRRGNVGMRALAGAKNLQMQIGDFVLVPDAEAESAAEIERAPDGSARVTCKVGSVGVLALYETQSAFMQPGDSLTISADGTLVLGTSVPAPAAPAARRTRSNAGYVALGLLAGGGTAAVAVLATRQDRAPASPSTP